MAQVMSLKLLIDTHDKRVLFAEVGKDCVDFLFHILSLPVASFINLLSKHGEMGSLTNLYESIETLNSSYIQPNQTKMNLLNPQVTGVSSVPLLALQGAPSTGKKNMSWCQYCYFDINNRRTCPTCSRNMIPDEGSGCVEGGYVKEVVTYMVMDDLVVTPMSSISSITLLNKFHVKNVATLEEKDVKLSIKEVPKLLNASLHSKKVLTDVFLGST